MQLLLDVLKDFDFLLKYGEKSIAVVSAHNGLGRDSLRRQISLIGLYNCHQLVEIQLRVRHVNEALHSDFIVFLTASLILLFRLATRALNIFQCDLLCIVEE